MEYPHNKKLLRNQKQWTIDICYCSDDPQRTFADKKADQKKKSVSATWFHLDKILENITLEMKSRSVVALGWGGQ